MGHTPWSVKGIDPKARAKAREHAQRDGLTLGTYLNRLLLEDSDSTDHERPASPLNPILRGEAGADRVSEVADTLEEIARRMNAGENRSTQALAGVDQSMLTLLNRLESTERNQSNIANRFDGALKDMRTTHASLEERLDSLSRKDNSRRMLDAMRALEGALTKLSKEVHETKDQVAEEQHSLRDEVQRGVSYISKEVDSISRRVDDTISEKIGKMGREVSDRVGSIESRVGATDRKSDDAVSRLDRIERNAEDRHRDILGRTETALDNLRSQTRKTDERFSKIEDRLDNTHRAAETALKTSQNSFNDLRESLKSFASHTDSKLDEALNTADSAIAIAKKNVVETAEEINKRNHELADKLFGNISDVEERLSTAQKNVTSMFAKVSDVGTRLEKSEASTQSSETALKTLQDAMERINERFSAAEENKTNAISQLEKSYSSLDERLDEIQDKVGETANIREEFEEKLASIAENFSKSMEEARKFAEDRSSAPENTELPDAVDALQKQMESVQADIASAENRQLQAVELITNQFERLSNTLDERLRGIEGRSASENAVSTLRQEFETATQTINERLNSIDSGKTAQMGTLADQIGKIATHLEEQLKTTNRKIDDTERRSAEAIEQVGEHVARATERLQARNEASFENIYDKIDEVSRETRSHLSSTMEDIERRLQEARELSERIVSPVQNTVSSLAQRMDALSTNDEDFDAGIEPPPHAQSELEDEKQSHGFDSFIEDIDLDDDDGFSVRADDFADESFEILSDFEENPEDSIGIFDDEDSIDETPLSNKEARPATPSNVTIQDEDIAEIAYGARREFAAELAEQRAQLEAEADLFRENDKAIADIPSAFSQNNSAGSFRDSDTDAFTSSLELEYEADLPHNSNNSYLRSDVGLDDDPFARASQNSSEFLKSARKAAQERGMDNRVIATGHDERKSNKLPMVAASVLAVAVAGGAGMMAMRGKQINSDEAYTTAPPKFNPDAQSNSSHSEDEDTLFDAKEEAIETQANLERDNFAEEVGVQIDEQILFPEEAKILTAENIREANATPTTLLEETSKRVSPLDAFASSRTKPVQEAVPTPVTLEAAAEAGSAIALHELAIKLLESGDKKVAAENMRKAADQGLASAQYRMAKLYERGEGLPRSIKESRTWTKRAAENGNVKAMHDLAVFFAEGEGGEQSFIAGVEWFTRAAEHGLVDSQYNLGVLYEQGLGVSQDPAKAAYWFKIAGNYGDADAVRRSREILKKLPESEVRQIESKVNNFVPRQTNGLANGQFGSQAWNPSMKAQIAETQRLLSRVSNVQLTPDGVMGPNTSRAIRSFEASNGLEVTGEVTTALLEKLRASAMNAS